MKAKIKKYITNAICVLFLAYGAVRLGVSSLLLLQVKGVLEFSDLQEGVIEVNQFMSIVEAQALIAFSATGYLAYLWVMGLFLVSGALGCFLMKRFGKICICIFLFLYLCLFINFQIINPKIVHLLICALLLAIYHFVEKSGFSVSKTNHLTNASA